MGVKGSDYQKGERTVDAVSTTPSKRELTQQDEIDLAYAFNAAMRDMFDGEPIPLSLTASAVAQFMAGYLVQVSPTERALIMSDMVEVMLDAVHANPCLDIMLN